MKKLFLMLCVSSLFSEVAYADYMCGSSPCYSEGSCDQETGYCYECSDAGYGHNAEGKSVKCQDPNCGAGCEDDYTYCGECKDGWLSYNGKCEKILENCPDGCESCSDNIQCDWCKSGYYRADNGTCIKNDVPNCKNIENNGLCSSCETGYLLSDGKCVTQEECITKGYKISNEFCVPQNCYTVSANHGTCSKCKSGLALQYNKCVPDTCEEGYHLTGSENDSGSNNQYFWNYKRCVADNCNDFSDYQISCTSCKEGYYLQDRECVSECKEGYIAGTNKYGYPSCFPAELGCGYGEKQVGDKCVAREDGEGCGVGFYLKDNLCVSESKGCGDGYLGKDGVCISSADGCGAGYRQFENFCNRIQYTPAEAAALLKDDDNFVILTFKK